jgi:MoxR-like ATPase
MTPSNPEAVAAALDAVDYLADDATAVTVFLATKLEKPLLVEGPPGVGKTELAKALAKLGERRLIRLQCYEGLDETRALYEWEYTKQLLYTQMLRDSIAEVVGDAPDLAAASDRLAAQESAFFSERFLLPRPLLQALTSHQPAVLLIDEIDRADEAFEAFLLELLSDFQVSIPELGTITAKHRPWVVLTSNNTRSLADALRRRCLYLWLDYPSYETELAIVERRVPGLAQELAAEAVRFVQRLRRGNYRKPPSISEMLDWAYALTVLNADGLDEALLDETLGLLLKDHQDLELARRSR